MFYDEQWRYLLRYSLPSFDTDVISDSMLEFHIGKRTLAIRNVYKLDNPARNKFVSSIKPFDLLCKDDLMSSPDFAICTNFFATNHGNKTHTILFIHTSPAALTPSANHTTLELSEHYPP